jgi:hypothetical protein
MAPKSPPNPQRGPAPPLPEGAPGRPPNNRYKAQFGLIVIAADEAEQQSFFARLIAMGFQPKVVVT